MENEEKVQESLREYTTYAIVSKSKDGDGKFFTVIEDLFTIKSLNVVDYMCRLLNDVASPFYFNHKNMFLAQVCTIDGQDAIVKHCNVVPKILCPLSEFIRANMRRYQQTIQILNYTPSGYYKKSEEERKEIQSRIDEAIVDYVSKYVAPDISEQLTDDKMESIKHILNNDSVNSLQKH